MDRRLVRSLIAVVGAAALAACSSGPPQPVPVQASEPCAYCRMAISDPHFAAQIVAPGEEPRFFDDIGCMAAALKASAAPAGAIAYVADRRTGAWVRASAAIYTHVPTVATPMGSHLIAHADAASRDNDDVAKGGAPRTVPEVFGPAGPPGATHEP